MWREMKRLTAKAVNKTSGQSTQLQRRASVATSSWWLYVSVMVAICTLTSCSSSPATGCDQGLTMCNGRCSATAYDVFNCGACGNPCAMGLVCSNSQCKATCDPGLVNRNDNCMPSQTSAATSIGGTTGSTMTTSSGAGSVANTGMGGSTATTTTTTTTGTAGATGTTTGTAGSTGVVVPGGGYFTAGTWKGYVWAGTNPNGGTITPTSFADKTTYPICVSGSVTAEPKWQNVAFTGWNINQANGPDAPKNTLTPTKAGVIFQVTNKGSSALRAQIQGPKGETDESDRWCATITGSGGFIPFTKFNTKCWDDTGTAYANQPIVAAMILVPCSNTADTPFNFCVDKIEESDK